MTYTGKFKKGDKVKILSTRYGANAAALGVGDVGWINDFDLDGSGMPHDSVPYGVTKTASPEDQTCFWFGEDHLEFAAEPVTEAEVAQAIASIVGGAPVPASDHVEWGVLDEDTGYVHPGFASEQDAKDWADPNARNPNPGNWRVVSRRVCPWT